MDIQLVKQDYMSSNSMIIKKYLIICCFTFLFLILFFSHTGILHAGAPVGMGPGATGSGLIDTFDGTLPRPAVFQVLLFRRTFAPDIPYKGTPTILPVCWRMAVL